MYGTVQAKPRGATTWTTCDWTVGTVSFSNSSVKALTFASSSYTASSSFGPVTRANVYVEPGCGIKSTATWFLPQKLGFAYADSAVNTESGAAWYQGYAIASSPYTNYGYDSSCSRSYYTFEGNYVFSSITAGSSYLAYE